MVHLEGCSQFGTASGQSRLNVDSVLNPRISRSSWIRKENVDTDVPMKNLQNREKMKQIQKLIHSTRDKSWIEI